MFRSTDQPATPPPRFRMGGGLPALPQPDSPDDPLPGHVAMPGAVARLGMEEAWRRSINRDLVNAVVYRHARERIVAMRRGQRVAVTRAHQAEELEEIRATMEPEDWALFADVYEQEVERVDFEMQGEHEAVDSDRQMAVIRAMLFGGAVMYATVWISIWLTQGGLKDFLLTWRLI